jgi:hypothetical protein
MICRTRYLKMGCVNYVNYFKDCVTQKSMLVLIFDRRIKFVTDNWEIKDSE